MIVGYARVSTEDQRLDLQLDALTKAGCGQIFTDLGRSGFLFNRDGLEAALNSVKADDTLVVWRLDRLGRSLSGLVHLVEKLGQRGVDFRSLSENIDTCSSGGKLMFHIMAALAEFERSLISERTRAGMAAAKTKGITLGRPRALTSAQLSDALYSVNELKQSPEQVATRLHVSPRTIYRGLSSAAAC